MNAYFEYPFDLSMKQVCKFMPFLTNEFVSDRSYLFMGKFKVAETGRGSCG